MAETESKAEPNKKLFVGNLPWKIRWQDLKDIFNEYANVEYAKVILDRDTRRSKGFGFVTCESTEEAKKAKEVLDGAEVEGREIRVDFAIEKDDNDSDEG